MPLPGGLNTITVTGTYMSATGTALSGSVSFTPSAAVMDAAGTTVISMLAVTATLTAGSFSITLPCTDNAGLVPAGWLYTCSVSVPGSQQSFPCYLPHALGPTVDITSLAPVAGSPSPSGVSYLPNASTVPADGPSLGGGFLYAENGTLYWLSGNNIPVPVGPGAEVNTGIVPPAGDIGGTNTGPLVTGIRGTPVGASPGGTTDFLRADGTWDAPPGSGSGIVPPAGDIGGSTSSPTVVSTHLASALPLIQGGTGQQTQQAALNALAGGVTAAEYLRGTGSNVQLAAIQPSDVPTLNQNTSGTASNITATLDQVPAPAASVSLNSKKITTLANGTASTDAANLGQVGVTSVTPADTSIVVSGTAAAPAIATATLDVIAADHPPAAAWSNNSKKITSLANGAAGSDAAAFGQIPVVDTTAADFQPVGVAAAGSNGEWSDSGHAHPWATGEPLTSGEALFPRVVWTQQQSLTGGTMALTYWTACKTETANHVVTVTGGTAASGLTYAAIGIYTIDGSGNLTLAASTGDLHTTLWASTFTQYTSTLTSGFAKVAGTRYALALLAVTGTPPNLFAQYISMSNIAPIIAGTSSQTTLPGTLAHGSVSTNAYSIAFQAAVTP